jgi:Na+/H+ antiporter NhaC
MNLGIVSLIPPLFIIVFAILTKKTFSALIFGSVLSYLIMYGTGFFGVFIDGIYAVLKDGDTIWVILLTGLIGVFIAVVSNSGGVDAITQYILKITTNQRRTLLGTWLLGILFFIGDVSNIGTVGVAMKRVCDRQKVPRESLAYILDSTAAPVCVLVPVSSWGVFYAGVFMAEPSLNFSGNPISMYLQVVPFMFYSMAAIVVVFLFAGNWIPKIGPMKKAYARVAETGNVYSEKSAVLNVDEDTEIHIEPGWKMLYFLIPLALLVIWALRGSFMEGCIIAIAIAALLYIPTKAMSFDKFCKLCMQGFSNMLSPIFIIVAAFLVRDALIAMGLPNYISVLVEPIMNVKLYPMVIFVTVAALSFTTGSNWGVPAVMVPILVPVGLSLGSNPYILLAAIASGGSFGSHACFYSDATVFTSAVTKIDNMEHALTQLPYALISAGAAALMFLVAGIAIN